MPAVTRTVGSLDPADETDQRYTRKPGTRKTWLYNGLLIHADVETHRFVTAFASRNFKAGSRVLDVAAGNGALTRQLQDAGMEVSCTSWNGKTRVEAPTFALNLDLPFNCEDVGGAKYPLVCAIEIIEHLENPASFLRHLHDIVDDGGFVILSTPNVESAQARLEWLIRGCPYIFDGDEIRKNRHISMMWRPGLEFLIEQAGFEIVDKHLLGQFQFSTGLQAIIRKPILECMERLLRGDLRGTTRLYVLRTQPGKAASRPGPEQFN